MKKKTEIIVSSMKLEGTPVEIMMDGWVFTNIYGYTERWKDGHTLRGMDPAEWWKIRSKRIRHKQIENHPDTFMEIEKVGSVIEKTKLKGRIKKSRMPEGRLDKPQTISIRMEDGTYLLLSNITKWNYWQAGKYVEFRINCKKVTISSE